MGINNSKQKINPIRNIQPVHYFYFNDIVEKNNADRQVKTEIKTTVMYENTIYFSSRHTIEDKHYDNTTLSYKSIIGKLDLHSKKYSKIYTDTTNIDFKMMGGYLFVYSNHGNIYKMDRNGTIIYSHHLHNNITDILCIDPYGIFVFGSKELYKFNNNLNLISTKSYPYPMIVNGFCYEQYIYMILQTKDHMPHSIYKISNCQGILPELNISSSQSTDFSNNFEWNGLYRITTITGFNNFIYAGTKNKKIIKWTCDGKNPKIISEHNVCANELITDSDYLYSVFFGGRQRVQYGQPQYLITIIKYDKNDCQLATITYDAYNGMKLSNMSVPKHVIVNNNIFYAAENDGIRIFSEKEFSITMSRKEFMNQYPSMQYAVIVIKWFQKQMILDYGINIPNDIIDFILHLM